MPPRIIRRPHTIGGRRLQDVLERLRSEQADVRPAIYVKPDGDQGIHVIRYPCSTTEVKVGSALRGETFRPGSSVLLGSHAGEARLSILAAPPPGQRGSSAFPFVSTLKRAQRPTLLGMVPSILAPGFSSSVTFIGSDFLDDPVDVLTAVVYDEALEEWVADPFVTVTNPISWTDSETVSATVSVSQSAPAGRPLWFDASRGGS